MIITTSVWNVLFIFRSYIDAQGKKKVNFSEKLNSKMSERPKSPVIKDMQHYILPKIEESFKSYIIVSNHANFLKSKKNYFVFSLKRFHFNILLFCIYLWMCSGKGQWTWYGTQGVCQFITGRAVFTHGNGCLAYGRNMEKGSQGQGKVPLPVAELL